MVGLYIIPDWFFSYTIILGLIFGIITLVVGLYSLKIYRLSNQRQSKLFGVGFILISISYFIRAILTIILFSQLQIQKVIDLSTFNLWSTIGLYVHLIFFLAGLITIFYMTIGVKSKRVYSILFILLIAALLFNPVKITFFNLFSIVFLVYIVIHYLLIYLKNKQLKNIVILIAFTLILLSTIDLIFSVNKGIHYVIADIVSLIAYLIIMINLIVIARKK